MAFRIRPREGSATLASIAFVSLIVATFSTGAVLYLDAQGTRGVETGISERSGADLALRASLSLGSNADRQDDEVRAAIDDTFAPSGVDVQVTRTLASHVTVHAVTDDPDSEDRGGSAASIPDFAELAQVVDGAAPSGSTEVAVQADAAKELGLKPGQDVLIAGIRFTVSGTWRPVDARDPRWYGDPMIDTGFNDDFGPLVINEDAWGRLDVNPEVTWTIVPNTSDITSRNTATLIDAWGGIQYDWRTKVSGIESLSVQNRLVQTLREVQQQLDGLRAVEPVAFTLVTAIGLVVVSQLVRLLALTRRQRSELYWARGESTRKIAARSARDVFAAGLTGALLGFAIVVVGALAIGSRVVDVNPGLAGLAPPLVVLLASIVVAAISNRQVGGADLTRAVRQRRRRAPTVPGLVLLVVLAAGVSVWQLRLYGSPLTPTASGTGGVDPIAVVAPAAALVAVVLVIVTVFPRVASASEIRVGRSSVVGQLAARGLRLRAAVVAAPLIVMALAVGSVTAAAGFSATWDTAFTETSALRVGSDLHANNRLAGIPNDEQDAARQVEGVDALAAIEVQPFSIGSELASIVAVSPDSLASLANSVPGKFDPAAEADAVRVDIPGPVVPADASSLTLTVEATGFVAPPGVSVWVSNPAGFLRNVRLTQSTSTSSAVDTQLVSYEQQNWKPSVPGPWRIAAIDFTFVGQDFEAQNAVLHLQALDATSGGATTAIALDQAWITDVPGTPSSVPTIDASRPGFYVSEDSSFARMTPSLAELVDDNVIFPILVSQQLADRFSVAVGDPLAFNVQVGVERLSCRVVGIVAAVPGAPLETALMIDLGVIQHFQLRTKAVPPDPRDVWIATDHPTATASALQQVLPSSTSIESKEDSAGRQVLGSAASVLWAAAVGALLLAIVGVASSARARVRSGRNDLGVLRALGLTGQAQAAIVSREFLVVIMIGAVGGLLAGLLVCVLTIPYFARAAVVDPYFAIATELRFDLVALAILLAILAAAVTLVLITLSRTVQRMARHAVPGEATE